MRLVRDDITAFARRYGLRQGVEAAGVIKAARVVLPQVLPDVLHSEVIVQAYREGTLFLTAPTGSALATVYQYRQALLQKLKEYLGRAVVERIVIKPTARSSASSGAAPQVE